MLRLMKEVKYGTVIVKGGGNLSQPASLGKASPFNEY